MTDILLILLIIMLAPSMAVIAWCAVKLAYGEGVKLWKKEDAKAEDEAQAAAVKAERLFQQGLDNILNYTGRNERR